MPLEKLEDIGILFGFFLITLLAVGQLFLKRKEQKNYLIIVFFSSLAIYQLIKSYHMFTLVKDWFGLFPYIYISGMFVIYCANALAFILFTSMAKKEFVFSRKKLLHFIIPVAVVVILIIFADFPENPGGRPRDYTSFLFNNVTVIRLTDIFSVILFYVYFSAVIIIYLKLYLKSHKKSLGNFLLMLVFFFLTSLLTALYILYHLDIQFFSSIYRMRFTILAIFVFLTSYSNPFILNIKKLESPRDYYQKSYLENINTEKVISSLENLMIEKEFFADETLTINTVAHYLGITRHQLSEILNLHLHKTFSQYIREKRMDQAKELLSGNPSFKIIDIANECGYGSISNFNSSFKKMYGITPGEYRNTTRGNSKKSG